MKCYIKKEFFQDLFAFTLYHIFFGFSMAFVAKKLLPINLKTAFLLYKKLEAALILRYNG